MPIIVSGTQITFNDATVQTTAGLTSANAVTSLNGQTGAITNTDFNVIGSPAVLYYFGTSDVSAGSTASGANLGYGTGGNNTPPAGPFKSVSTQRVGPNATTPGTGVNGGQNTTAVSGTWRAMNYANAKTIDCCTTTAWAAMWVRVS